MIVGDYFHRVSQKIPGLASVALELIHAYEGLGGMLRRRPIELGWAPPIINGRATLLRSFVGPRVDVHQHWEPISLPKKAQQEHLVLPICAVYCN